MGLILILVGTFNCLIKIITRGQFSNRWILVGICHSVPTKLYALENHNKRCLTLDTIVSMYLFRSTLNKEKRGLEPYFCLWMWNLASRKQINLYFAIAYPLSSSQTIQRKQISHLQNEIGLTWKKSDQSSSEGTSNQVNDVFLRRVAEQHLTSKSDLYYYYV